MTTLAQSRSTIIGEPEVVEDASTAEASARLARPEGRGHRAAAAADAGRQHPEEGRPRGGQGARRAHHARHPRPRARLPARRRLPRPRPSPTSRSWVAAGFGVPDFYDALVAFAPAADRDRQEAPPGGLPDVHAERLDRPPRRGAHRRGDLAGVHRQGRGDLHEQAVRLAAPRRLHARLRHQLGGAVPRDRGDARDPGVHLGRAVRGPRGGSVPPRRPRGRSDHEARAAAVAAGRCSPIRRPRKRRS